MAPPAAVAPCNPYSRYRYLYPTWPRCPLGDGPFAALATTGRRPGEHTAASGEIPHVCRRSRRSDQRESVSKVPHTPRLEKYPPVRVPVRYPLLQVGRPWEKGLCRAAGGGAGAAPGGLSTPSCHRCGASQWWRRRKTRGRSKLCGRSCAQRRSGRGGAATGVTPRPTGCPSKAPPAPAAAQARRLSKRYGHRHLTISHGVERSWARALARGSRGLAGRQGGKAQGRVSGFRKQLRTGPAAVFVRGHTIHMPSEQCQP